MLSSCYGFTYRGYYLTHVCTNLFYIVFYLCLSVLFSFFLSIDLYNLLDQLSSIDVNNFCDILDMTRIALIKRLTAAVKEVGVVFSTKLIQIISCIYLSEYIIIGTRRAGSRGSIQSLSLRAPWTSGVVRRPHFFKLKH